MASMSANMSRDHSPRMLSTRLPALNGSSTNIDMNQRSELTSSPDSRVKRLPPTVPSSADPKSLFPSPVAISAPYNTNYQHQRQDVRFVNTSASYSYPSTATRTDVLFTGTNVSTPPSSNHDLTSSLNRPRTSHRVFTSSQDLAAHYGIPQILPPAPRTTPRSIQESKPVHTQRSPVINDFESIRANYLSMLSEKPNDTTSAAEVPTTISPAVLQAPLPSTEFDAAQLESLANYISSPEFKAAVDFHDNASPVFNLNPSDYLTSPMETPMIDFDDINTSPLDDSPFDDFLNTPVIADSDDPYLTGAMPYDHDMALFADIGAYQPLPVKEPTPVVSTDDKVFENLYTISPVTPALHSLDPSSLYPSPSHPSVHQFPPTTPETPVDSTLPSAETRRKTSATGTRKGLKPELLVPIDAPTQPRRYVTPSATSRKELPAVFAKKRGRSQAFGDEEDELQEEPLGPNATEREQIEWKRRQNTLAARKSRKRKLEHQQELEESVRLLTQEKEVWRTRALTLQQMLQSAGVPFNEFQD